MKVLYIFISKNFDKKFFVLNRKLYKDASIDKAFVYSGFIDPKYTAVKAKYVFKSPYFQLGKLVDFLKKVKLEEDYDWFVKTRPEIKLVTSPDFSSLDMEEISINARARGYIGNPIHVPKGCSVGGYWYKCYEDDIRFDKTKNITILDDQIYIFNDKVRHILKNAKDDKLFYTENVCQNEWYHSYFFKQNNIKLNIIGLDVAFYRKGKLKNMIPSVDIYVQKYTTDIFNI